MVGVTLGALIGPEFVYLKDTIPLSAKVDTASLITALCPKWSNNRRGSYVFSIIGAAICPWNFANKLTTFITVLSSWSVFQSPRNHNERLFPRPGSVIPSWRSLHRQQLVSVVTHSWLQLASISSLGCGIVAFPLWLCSLDPSYRDWQRLGSRLRLDILLRLFRGRTDAPGAAYRVSNSTADWCIAVCID